MGTAIKTGDRAPDFALPSQDGQVVRLADLLTRGKVVVYFYPKDRTPGCAAEAGAFRDNYAKFAEMGVEVVGISSDSVQSHQGFAYECGLPFKILSDRNGEVRREYGVSATMGLIPGRVTFVIDKGGIVLGVFESQFQAARHAKEALEVLSSKGTQRARVKEPLEAGR